MGIFDIFRKKDRSTDSVTHLTLKDLRPGWMVDHLDRTLEVTAYNQYDWGEGDVSYEWQVKDAYEILYLELESDDEDDWSLNRKIEFKDLGPGLKEHILEKGDPPEQISFEGRTYYLQEVAGGHFLKDGRGPGQPMLRWSYEDDTGERYLGIEQWDEEEFEASTGQPVEEYQFQKILPR